MIVHPDGLRRLRELIAVCESYRVYAQASKNILIQHEALVARDAARRLLLRLERESLKTRPVLTKRQEVTFMSTVEQLFNEA